MKKIFIFGAGYFGEEVFEYVKNNYNILGFIDSDKKKIKKKIKKKKFLAHQFSKKLNLIKFSLLVCGLKKLKKNWKQILKFLNQSYMYFLYQRYMD